MNDSDLSGTSSLATNLQVLHHERLKHKNPMKGYLNINSLQNKLTDLKVTLKYLSLDYFVLSETTLPESFPNAQFTLDSYEIWARGDRNKFRGGLIEYARKDLFCKRVAKYEPKFNECICSEINFSKKKWVICSIYRLPNTENLTGFFQEMTTSLIKVTQNYDENIIAMGDFNMDIKRKRVVVQTISVTFVIFFI